MNRAGLEPATDGLKVRRCYQTELSILMIDIRFHGYSGLMSCRDVSRCRFVSPLRFNLQRARMIQAGFEPATVRLEGVCSIQLSYWTLLEYSSNRIRTCDRTIVLVFPLNYRRNHKKREGDALTKLLVLILSIELTD